MVFFRIRSVCKRWNTIVKEKEKRFFNSDLGLARPQFILLANSMICSVEVNLDGPSIEVHKLPQYIPGYHRYSMFMTLGRCHGLLMFGTRNGIGICNPWLRQIRWIESPVDYIFNGIGYDSSGPDNHYKIVDCQMRDCKTYQVYITEFGSDARKIKTYDFAMYLFQSSISLNGTLYWIAYNQLSGEQCIQTFDCSTERFEFYCIYPNKITCNLDIRSLEVYMEDRFSVLEQNYNTRDIEIWVTKEKIQKWDGEAVEWMKLMNVLVPEWSSLKFWSIFPPSYFIDEKSLSLVLCCYDKAEKACIYIAKGNKFHEIKINELVHENLPPHRTYFPSLVHVPRFTMSGRGPVESRFSLPNGIEVRNGVGGNVWDDGYFDQVKKIYIGKNDSGGIFVKFGYIKHNAKVAGLGHGNGPTTHLPKKNKLNISYGEYIEYVEGTYTESQITSITFRLNNTRMLRYGRFKGTYFLLRREGSKIMGFYGRHSDDHHLTALGVHFSAPPPPVSQCHF
ncbi:unnamed protein product [Eruca vesicaria subsp. sativa]|uniref:Jacalin-type lectin domain-containing protein n=1 Tax=Eruca vesicaria subsp. sativa TaxID=29727 RepID=A0ABC8J244_ERUVS|nr:unnamed protein product [Eruca vesicaria subsp. sativa]